jgi:hypothetical protein
MKLDEMQSAWNSPHNHPASEEQQQLAQQFVRQMIRRRRFQAIWLTNTFVWLTLATAALVKTLVVGKGNLTQEWAMLPLLALPWIVAVHFLRRHLKPTLPVPSGSMPVAEVLQAALASNRTERSHLKLVAALQVGLIPFVALAVQQLHAAGKLSPTQQTCMVILFGAVLLVGMLGVAVRYFGRLMPQGRHLNALLSELTT